MKLVTFERLRQFISTEMRLGKRICLGAMSAMYPMVLFAQRFPDYADDIDGDHQYSFIDDLFSVPALLFACFLVVVFAINFLTSKKFAFGVMALAVGFGICTTLLFLFFYAAHYFNISLWALFGISIVSYLIADRVWSMFSKNRDGK